MSVPWGEQPAAGGKGPDIEGDLRRAIEAISAPQPYRPAVRLVSPATKQYLEDLEGYVRVLQRDLDRLPRRQVLARWHRRALLNRWWRRRWRDLLRDRVDDLRYRGEYQ